MFIYFQVFETEERYQGELRRNDEIRKTISKLEKRGRHLESMLEDERKAGEIAHDRNESLAKKLKKMRETMEVSV